MKLRLTFLLCALSLALPALAATSNTGGPSWGALPGAKKPQFHGECCYTARALHGVGGTTGRGVGGGQTNQQCDLTGVWAWTDGFHLSPDTQTVRLTFFHPYIKAHKAYWADHSQVVGIHEFVEYDPHTQKVWIWGAANPVFEYGTGTLSRDCHHIYMQWRISGYGTRNTREDFVRRR